MHIRKHNALRCPCQRGVTLIEVIFSIGVILIGLVGLMAILPLAGEQAQNAVDLNTGTSVADVAFDELLAGNRLSSEALILPSGTVPIAPLNVCVDPLHVAAAPTVGNNGYSPLFFPHFKRRHDPLRDPSEVSAGSVTWPADQPRLLRAGYRKPQAPGLAPYTLSEALTLVESEDDLSVERPDDRSRDATLRGNQVRSLSYGKRLPSGEYSWLATLDPHSNDPFERHAILSVAVLHNRNRSFAYPTDLAATPEDNRKDERLALVVNAFGFEGGAGGVVELASSANTEPDITSRNWIMLSRNTANGPRHRWYRVAGVEGNTQFGTASDFSIALATDPSSEIWIQRVLIDGSDWPFAPTTNAANATFATIVEDVVSVAERVVPIENTPSVP